MPKVAIYKRVVEQVSAILFGGILVCFFLPFIDVTRYRLPIASFTGFDIVTGATAEKLSLDPDPLALLVLVAAIVGLGLSFLTRHQISIVPASSAGLGLILMLFLKWKLDNYARRAMEDGKGTIRVGYDIGFWISVSLFLISVGVSGFVFWQAKRRNLTENSDEMT